MERRVIRKVHARCGVGENPEADMCSYATHGNQRITYHYLVIAHQKDTCLFVVLLGPNVGPEQETSKWKP